MCFKILTKKLKTVTHDWSKVCVATPILNEEI